MPETVCLPSTDGALRVEYLPSAMEQIRDRAQKGLTALPRIGMGVGGLLLGEMGSGRVRLLESIEIPCSHANGPSFKLTDAEIDRARELIADGAGPSVIGWYCSKTQGEATLSESDLALYRLLFPERGRITLVVRPSSAEPMFASFFVPNSAGELVKGAGCEIDKLREAVPSAAQPINRPTAPAAANIPLANIPLKRAAVPEGKSRGKAGWAMAAAALMLAGAAAFLTQSLWSPRPALTLSSSESDGALVMRWNREAVKGIDHASMSLNDGGKLETLLLNHDQLDSGSLRYMPKTERVTAKLKAGEASAIAFWLKPAPPPAPPREPEPAAETRAVQAQPNQRRRYRLPSQRLPQPARKPPAASIPRTK